MKLHYGRTVLLAAIIPFTSATAIVFDLRTDWSNTSNPNGAWSYLVNGAVAPSGTRGGDSFGPPGPPPVWGSGHIGWSQSNGSQNSYLDLQTGDIYGHGETVSPISILWTSPITETVHVTGGVWALREGRSNDWSVTLNGSTLMASGQVFTGDPFNRANPNPFDFTVAVQPGDFLELRIVPTSGQASGDYSGVNFTVVPEPAPAALAALGLLAAARRSRRSRSELS